MRIVAVAFLAAVILHSSGPVIVSAITHIVPEAWSCQQCGPWNRAQAAEPVNHVDASKQSSPFHDEQFVYISPPAQKATDPRFFSDAFEFVPNGKSGGTLVQPVYGIVPLSSLKNSASSVALQPSKHAPTPTPVKHSPIEADAVSDDPVDLQISTAPEPVASPTSAMSESSGGTVTPTPTIAPSVSTPAMKPTPVISGTLVDADDIEDPRFYRGSYVFDPEERVLKSGVIDAAPNIADNSPGKASGKPNSDSSLNCTGCTPAEVPKSDSAFPRYGRAMYYNPGIMEVVLSFRLEAGHVNPCSDCVGFAALMGAEDLNRKVWIEWSDGVVEGPFLVIDAAAKHHIPSLQQRNWVIDIDYATAMRHGMNRPLPVTVWDQRPGSGQKAAGM